MDTWWFSHVLQHQETSINIVFLCYEVLPNVFIFFSLVSFGSLEACSLSVFKLSLQTWYHYVHKLVKNVEHMKNIVFKCVIHVTFLRKE